MALVAPPLSAVRRLMRDHLEIQRFPLECAVAQPLEDNVLEWHANLRPITGPLAGCTFHIKLIFSPDYPKTPPKLLFPGKDFPSFRHPNLYGDWLCLDMLQNFMGRRDRQGGWTSGYTVQAILLQLTSFLFDFDKVPQDNGGYKQIPYTPELIRRVREETWRYSCDKCAHCGRSHWPSFHGESMGSLATTMDRWSGHLKPYDDYMRRKAEKAECLRMELEDVFPSKSKDDFFCGGTLDAMGSNKWSSIMGSVPMIPDSRASELILRIVDWGAKGELQIGIAHNGISKVATLECVENCLVAWCATGDIYKGQDVKHFSNMVMRKGDTVTVALNSKSDGATCLLNQTDKHSVKFSAARINEFFPILRARDAKVEIVADCGYALWRTRCHEGIQKRHHQERLAQVTKMRVDLSHLERVLEPWYNAQQHHVVRVEASYPCAPAGPMKGWLKLPRRLLQEIFTSVSGGANLATIHHVCHVWRQVGLSAQLYSKFEPTCFYTRYSSNETVLGVGLKVSYHPNGNIKEVDTPLDVLSYFSFTTDCVRKGVWHQEFTHFLPLVLDAGHCNRALPILEESIAKIVGGESESFEPWMVLALYPAVMNSFVVSLVQASTGQKLSRHTSEKALEGYCSFHHGFLALSQRHPEVVRIAAKRVKNFIQNPSCRTKAEVPDLGQFLVYLAIIPSKYGGWDTLAEPLLEEVFDRNVKWLLRAEENLDTAWGVDIPPAERLHRSFRGTLTSYRLLMFQALFLNRVARSPGVSRDKVLHRYNQQFGFPADSERDLLFQGCQRILGVSDWDGFFGEVAIDKPSDATLCCQLLSAISRSAYKKYHGQQVPPITDGCIAVLKRDHKELMEDLKSEKALQEKKQKKKDEKERKEDGEERDPAQKEKKKNEKKLKKEKKEDQEDKPDRPKKEKKEKKEKESKTRGSRFAPLLN